MLVVKFHIVKLCSLNAMPSSPHCLIQDGTFFLSDVLSELKPCTVENLFLIMLQVPLILGKKLHPLHLLKTKVLQKFFLKRCHRLLKSCEMEGSNYSQDSLARCGCHFKEICPNMSAFQKFLLWSFSACIRFTGWRQAWASFIKCQIFLSFNN